MAGHWKTAGYCYVNRAMSTNLISSGTTARQKVNLRTPDVIAAVQQQVESHYRSDIIGEGPGRRRNNFP